MHRCSDADCLVNFGKVSRITLNTLSLFSSWDSSFTIPLSFSAQGRNVLNYSSGFSLTQVGVGLRDTARRDLADGINWHTRTPNWRTKERLHLCIYHYRCRWSDWIRDVNTRELGKLNCDWTSRVHLARCRRKWTKRWIQLKGETRQIPGFSTVTR